MIFYETPKLILFSANDKFIAIVVDNLIYIFRRNGKEYTLHAKLQGHKENIYAISFDKEAKNICSADSFDIKIWDIDTGKCIKSFHDDGQGLIFSVIFHPSEATIITTSYKQIKIWSIINGNCIKTLSGHTNTVTCLSNNANGNYIFSGSCDSTLRVWDYFSGKEKYIESTNMHHDTILGMNRSFDENYLLTSSDDGAIKIWHIEESSLALVYEIHFDERLISAQLCIHANQILVATQNGIYFVDFPTLQGLINKYRHIFKNVEFTEEEKKQYYLN